MVDSDVTTKLRAPLWLLQITWRPRVILVLCEHTHGGVNRTKAVKEACRMKLDKHRLAKLSENNVVIMNYHLNGVVGCAGGWGGLERGGLDGPLGRGIGVQICMWEPIWSSAQYGERPSISFLCRVRPGLTYLSSSLCPLCLPLLPPLLPSSPCLWLLSTPSILFVIAFLNLFFLSHCLSCTCF